MKKLVTIFLLSFLSVNAQWRIIDTKIDTTLIDICFPDSLNGWAITTDIIIHSSDGGETWEQQTYPIQAGKIRKVCFVNNFVGYIAGYKGSILATKDGGLNWNLQKSGIDSVNHFFRDIFFIDENIGWITAQIDDSFRGGVILNTTNGGNTWLNQVYRKDGKGYFAIKFLDKYNGCVFASYGWDNFDNTDAYRTYDGGKHWEIIGTVTATPLFNIQMTSADTIWGSGYGFSRSFDGGKNWENKTFIETPPGDSTIWFPIIFGDLLKLSATEGYAIISRMQTDQKFVVKVYSTNDGGLHWKFTDVPDGFIPYQFATKKKSIFIAGLNGLVAKSDMVSYVDNIDPLLNFKLYQNFPNPFNPTTKITYSLSSDSDVKLVIFNSIGKKINTLINDRREAGFYNINWDGEDDNGFPVPSGVYFIHLTVQNKSLIKKAVLIH